MLRRQPRLVAGVVLALSAPAIAQPTTQATQPASRGDSLARVLRYVPDDAQLVLIVGNVERFAAGVAGFGKAIGVADLGKFSGDAFVRDTLGAPDGVFDRDQGLVMAVMANGDESILLGVAARGQKVATTRPTAFGDDAEMTDLGDDGLVVRTSDGVAILGREESLLRRATGSTGRLGKTLLQGDRGLLDRHPLVIYVDVPAWRDKVSQFINLIAQTTYLGMAAAGPDAEAAIQVQRWFFDHAQALLAELETYTVGLTASPEGLFVQDRAAFRPDGAAGRYLHAVRKPGRDLLRGLRAAKPAILFACEWELPPDVDTLESTMLKTLLELESLREKLGEEKLGAAIRQAQSMHRRLSGYNGAWEWLGAQGSLASGHYFTREPAEFMDDLRGLYTSTPEILSAWGSFPAMTVRHESVRAGERTIETFHLSIPEGGPPSKPDLAVIYGRDPQILFTRAEDGVVYAIGSAEASKAALDQAAKATGAPVREAPRVQAALARFSPDPQALMLVDLPAMLEFVAAMSEGMGVPLIRMECGDATLPLAGYMLHLDENACRNEVFVPAEPIRAFIESVERLQGATTQPAMPPAEKDTQAGD